MYLMVYVNDKGERVYTLQVRFRAHAVAKRAPLASQTCVDMQLAQRQSLQAPPCI